MARYFLRFAGVPTLLLLMMPTLLVAGLEAVTAARGGGSVSGVQWLPLLGVWAFLSIWLILWYFLIMLRIAGVEAVVREYARGLTGRNHVVLAFAQISGLGLVLAIGLGAIAVGILVSTGGLETASTLVHLYIAPWLLGFIWFTHTGVLPYILLRGTFHSDPIPDWPYGSY